MNDAQPVEGLLAGAIRRPHQIQYHKWWCKHYVEGNWHQYHNLVEADTEAEARAMMLVDLLENKII